MNWITHFYACSMTLRGAAQENGKWTLEAFLKEFKTSFGKDTCLCVCSEITHIFMALLDIFTWLLSHR